MSTASAGAHVPWVIIEIVGAALNQYLSLKGVSVSSVFLGIVIAFLGFGGFEGAAVFGEKTHQPAEAELADLDAGASERAILHGLAPLFP